jgi:hypothetical protein
VNRLFAALLASAALMLGSCDSNEDDCDPTDLVARCEAECDQRNECAAAEQTCRDNVWVCSCVPCAHDLGVSVPPPDGMRSDAYDVD